MGIRDEETHVSFYLFNGWQSDVCPNLRRQAINFGENKLIPKVNCKHPGKRIHNPLDKIHLIGESSPKRWATSKIHR